MIRQGTEVRWAWGSGHASGTVIDRLERSITRTIDGSEITRHGTHDDPALLIEQEDGQRVLKLSSEVDRDD